MKITLYGITSCDTVRKARRLLDQEGVDYRFHDLRADGLEPSRVDDWLRQLDPAALINRRSTSWRQLSEAQRADLSPAAVKALVLDNPTLIKRPVLEIDGRIEVGFSPERYQELLAS
ncbi:MAG: arsenate reductase [Gammaproteobacteria bacterium]|nr:arsenate reductase [Gammaproteobacteria bacterium]